jgi:hypothetical protein
LSSNPRPKLKPTRLRQVTPDTKFHIDYKWWGESGRDLKTYLITRLSLGEEVAAESNLEMVDLVDGRTGEVRQVDGFQFLVRAYFNQQPNDFSSHTSLVDGVFTVLLANGNEPMPIREIAQRIKRPADLLIKTLAGSQTFLGIRPLFDDEAS